MSRKEPHGDSRLAMTAVTSASADGAQREGGGGLENAPASTGHVVNGVVSGIVIGDEDALSDVQVARSFLV